MNICEQKKGLIEDFSAHITEVYNFPPLASKIFAYLVLDIDREGVSFDELLEIFCASKSSISTSLNFLTQINYIEHFNKIDNRKRYYRISKSNIQNRLQKIENQLSKELDFANRILEFKLERNIDPLSFTSQKSNIYIDHLRNSIEEIQDTINKLENISTKDIG